MYSIKRYVNVRICMRTTTYLSFLLIVCYLIFSCHAPGKRHIGIVAESEKAGLVKQYQHLKDSITAARQRLKSRLLHAATKEEKQQVYDKAGDLLVCGITNTLAPAWEGTPWNFYGQGDTPHVNSIACGYFVNTILKDMGVKLNVHALSICASGEMIKTLTQKDYISIYSKYSSSDFFKAVKEEGEGLYLVGLDNHTGMLVYTKDKLLFIDSSPFEVRKQPAAQSDFLVNSKFRMTGKISDDPIFLDKWLKNGEF